MAGVAAGLLGAAAVAVGRTDRRLLTPHAAQTDGLPSTSADFKQVRTIYSDLFTANNLRYHLADTVNDFPIHTDSRRLVPSEAVERVGTLLRRELIFSDAYGTASRPLPSHPAGPTLVANRAFPVAVLQDRRRLVVTNTSRRSPAHVAFEPVPRDQSAVSNDSVEMVYATFRQFLTERRNGDSPLGAEYRVPYDEFVHVYGYGQCENQSYALVDRLRQLGVRAALLRLSPGPHALVEAHVGGRDITLDPLFGATLDGRIDGAPDGRSGLTPGAARMVDMVAAKERPAFVALYADARVTRGDVGIARRPTADRTLTIAPGETAELLLRREYPWISVRNVTLPPDSSVGFVRVTRVLHAGAARRDGEWLAFDLAMPFPLVDIEIPAFARSGIAAVAVVDGAGTASTTADQVDDAIGPIHLARLLRRDGRQYHVTLRVKVTTPRPAGWSVQARLISQVSLVRLVGTARAHLRVVADSGAHVTVVAE